MAPGTDGNLITYDTSGNPAAVATGSAAQVLTSAGAGAVPSFQTATVPDDAITLAKMAPGTDGNIISYDTSGNPVAVATGSDGQVLTSAGAGAVPTFETLPAGGITVADQWRITADKSINNTANVFDANLEQVDGPAQGTLGAAMSVSSGVFTYPSTGTWLVMSNVLYTNSNSNPSTYVFTIHQNCTNGSNFTASSEAYTYFSSGVTGSSSTATGIDMVNVTNTSNVKTRFLGRSLENCVARGYSTINFTSFTFIRLGDST
jgi:hypothetical protein